MTRLSDQEVQDIIDRDRPGSRLMHSISDDDVVQIVMIGPSQEEDPVPLRSVVISLETKRIIG